MKYQPLPLSGAFLIELEPRADDRGFFARSYCADEFRAQGLADQIVQINVANTRRAGTVRGMHFQLDPHAEAKTVSCPRGSIYDVIIDLRAGSATFGSWHGVALSAANRLALHVPVGFAHGYQTLEDDVDIQYLTSAAYAGASARGVRFDDPAIGIQWPVPVTVVSEPDRGWPLFNNEPYFRYTP